ncbi:hypothetical protein CQ14_36950 [Bradyrhizobium lablabi]|uniref:Uncharacterized protein n=1 Tax=Bradyrhizobium lablabi TaxID=722472 RepID=A0A0R3MHY7_9BRAD|nr:hypothetical protein CQ14_36950 [Bradyrhizobium lablabi]
MCLIMTPLGVEGHPFCVQGTQITRNCKQDLVGYLKCFARAFLCQKRLRKRDCRIDIVWLLLQSLAQTFLVGNSEEGVCNALAHSRIDVLGAQQLWPRRLLNGDHLVIQAGATTKHKSGE